MAERQAVVFSVVGVVLLAALVWETSYYLSTYQTLSEFRADLESLTVVLDDCDTVRVSFALLLRNNGPTEVVVTRVDIRNLYLNGERLVYYSPHIFTIGVRTVVPSSTEGELTFETVVQPSDDLDFLLASLVSGDDSWEAELRIEHQAGFNRAIHAASLEWDQVDLEGGDPSQCV
jgi:hypothetical protein